MSKRLALNCSASSSAICNKEPKFKIARLFFSSLIVLLLPIGTSSDIAVTSTLGPVPRGYLTAAGPLCLRAVFKSKIVSFSSAGAAIIIFGTHLI